MLTTLWHTNVRVHQVLLLKLMLIGITIMYCLFITEMFTTQVSARVACCKLKKCQQIPYAKFLRKLAHLTNNIYLEKYLLHSYSLYLFQKRELIKIMLIQILLHSKIFLFVQNFLSMIKCSHFIKIYNFNLVHIHVCVYLKSKIWKPTEIKIYLYQDFHVQTCSLWPNNNTDFIPSNTHQKNVCTIYLHTFKLTCKEF
jgi:hypothetical protein